VIFTKVFTATPLIAPPKSSHICAKFLFNTSVLIDCTHTFIALKKLENALI